MRWLRDLGQGRKAFLSTAQEGATRGAMAPGTNWVASVEWGMGRQTGKRVETSLPSLAQPQDSWACPSTSPERLSSRCNQGSPRPLPCL